MNASRLLALEWGRWLAIGIILRLILMPFTMHNDTVWMPWMAYRIVEGHWNVYQYLFDVYGDKTLHPVVWAPYFPLYYWVTAAWTDLLKLTGLVDVGRWSFDSQRWYIEKFTRGIFLVKSLYIPFDLAIGWAVAEMVPTRQRAMTWAIWALSPVVLVSVYMMGQNDAMPTACVALAAYCGTRAFGEAMSGEVTERRWCDAAALLLGIGAGFKYYPLLLVVPFALVLGRRAWDIARFIILSLIPVVVVVAPYLSTKPFRDGVLLNPEAQNLFTPVGGIGPLGVSPFLAGYALFVGYLISRRSDRRSSPIRLPVVAFVVLALIFVTANWPFDWFVWLTPFIAWSVAVFPETRAYSAVYAAVFLIWTWNWGATSSTGLFSPILHGLTVTPSLKDWVARFYPYDRVVVVDQSILVGILLWHVFLLLRKREAVDEDARPVDQALVLAALFVGWIVVSFLPSRIAG